MGIKKHKKENLSIFFFTETRFHVADAFTDFFFCQLSHWNDKKNPIINVQLTQGVKITTTTP